MVDSTPAALAIAQMLKFNSSGCQRFNREQVVCPPKMRRKVFATATVDNIGRSPSTTTEKESFHVSAISILQHLSLVKPHYYTDVPPVTSNKTVGYLPHYYTDVPPVTSNKTPGYLQHYYTDVPSVTSNKTDSYLPHYYTERQFSASHNCRIWPRSPHAATKKLTVACCCMHSMQPSIRLAFGTGKSFRYLAAHETGCDTVSSFAGDGKKTARAIWTVRQELIDALLKLFAASNDILEDVMHTIGRFVILLYDRTSTCTGIDKT